MEQQFKNQQFPEVKEAQDYTPVSNRTKHRKSAFLKAYQATFGNIALSCQLTGIKARKTVYDWMAKDAKFKAEMNDQLETNKDFAEYQLARNIAASDQRAIEYFLNNKAKDRGYKKNADEDEEDVVPGSAASGITIHETRVYEDGSTVIDTIGEDVTDQEADG